MIQDATIDHRSTGNEGEVELRPTSKPSVQSRTRKLRYRIAMLDK